MFVFDIFKDDGGRLRIVAAAVGQGIFVLLAGLWWVQVVFTKHFETDLKKQSFRHVRHSGHSRGHPGSQRKNHR